MSDVMDELIALRQRAEKAERERDEERDQNETLCTRFNEVAHQGNLLRRRAEAAEALLARQAPVVEAARAWRMAPGSKELEAARDQLTGAVDSFDWGNALAALDQGSEGK